MGSAAELRTQVYISCIEGLQFTVYSCSKQKTVNCEPTTVNGYVLQFTANYYCAISHLCSTVVDSQKLEFIGDKP